MLNITISLKQSLPIDTTTSIYMVLSRGEHRVDSNNNRLDPKSIDEKCTDRIAFGFNRVRVKTIKPRQCLAVLRLKRVLYLVALM